MVATATATLQRTTAIELPKAEGQAAATITTEAQAEEEAEAATTTMASASEELSGRYTQVERR